MLLPHPPARLHHPPLPPAPQHLVRVLPVDLVQKKRRGHHLLLRTVLVRRLLVAAPNVRRVLLLQPLRLPLHQVVPARF